MANSLNFRIPKAQLFSDTFAKIQFKTADVVSDTYAHAHSYKHHSKNDLDCFKDAQNTYFHQNPSSKL